jgi:hypothetical protein
LAASPPDEAKEAKVIDIDASGSQVRLAVKLAPGRFKVASITVWDRTEDPRPLIPVIDAARIMQGVVHCPDPNAPLRLLQAGLEGVEAGTVRASRIQSSRSSNSASSPAISSKASPTARTAFSGRGAIALAQVAHNGSEARASATHFGEGTPMRLPECASD